MSYELPNHAPVGSLLKSGVKKRKSPAKRNKKLDHLKFIRMLPCLTTESPPPNDAAHIRYADETYGKPYTPKAMKPDDEWTIPLSREQHEIQHKMSEQLFWEIHRIDPCKVAQRLWAISGDIIEGTRIVRELHRRMK